MALKVPKQKTFTGPALIWKRVLAFVIDMLIINFIILFPFRTLFQKMIPASLSIKETFELANSGELNSLVILISVFASILMMLYFIILEGRLKQSIGKILTNIYVVSEAKEFKFWQLLIRNLFLIPVFPFILLWIADPIFMLFTKGNKRLSEILSKTKVVGEYKY
ncbi:RDD family protein [Candidatus Woesearchaeota archaeon]|nr:RDD family protein [Candidatus Woesearchaeota archaeon]